MNNPIYSYEKTDLPVERKPSPVKNILIGLAFIALYFVMQIVVTIVLEVGVTLGTTADEYETLALWEQAIMDKTLALSNMIIVIAAAITLLVIVLVFRKDLPKELNLKKVPFKVVLLGVVCGIACSFSLNLFFSFLPESWIESYNEDSAALSEGSFLETLLGTVVAAPIIEEVTFRGIGISRFRKVMPTWLAVLIISVVFGVMHGNFVWFIYTFALGCGMGFVFVRQDSLWASLAIHAGFNSVSLISFAIRDVPPATEYYVNIVYEAVTFAMIPIAALTLWLLLRKKIVGRSAE